MPSVTQRQHVLSLDWCAVSDLSDLLAAAEDLREKRSVGIIERPLEGKVLAVLFERSSLRTMLSFQAGMAELGGEAVVLDPKSVAAGKREPLHDVAEALSELSHGIAFRTRSHDRLKTIAKHCRVPLINGGSTLHDPCQALADLLAIKSRKNEFRDMHVGVLGHPSPAINTLVEVAPMLKWRFSIAVPPGHEPDRATLTKAMEKDATINIHRSAKYAVQDVDAVYVSPWPISVREDDEALKALYGFRLKKDLLDILPMDGLILHPGPSHPGVEADPDALDDPRNVSRLQTAAHLHVQKALLTYFL